MRQISAIRAMVAGCQGHSRPCRWKLVGSFFALACGLGTGPLLGAQAPATAPSTQISLPQTPLLPQQFGHWQAAPGAGADGAAPKLTADPALAAIARENGLKRTAATEYRAVGPGVLSAEAMQFGDATGAVAMYTYLRGHEMQEQAGDPVRHGNTNVAVGAGETVLREGPSLVVLRASGGAAVTAAEVRSLADTLPKIGGPQGQPPLLPTYLPAAGMVPRSLEYAVGPAGYRGEGGALPVELLGFDKAAEAATADYSGAATGRGRLTLLLLPTPEIAGARGRALEAWLNSQAASEANLGTVRLRRVGPLLALASNGFTPDQSKALLDGLHLRTEVTWNKPVPPEFHVEIRKTASLLTSIIVFSGVGALAAILLGLFLGFGRAWVRVLMGKPAATEAEFLSLDLRPGSSGPSKG